MQLRFNIPDISYLQQRSITFAINRIFVGGGPKDYETYFLLMNFIRLVDFAVREYTYGRRATLEFAETYRQPEPRSHLPSIRALRGVYR